MYNLFRQYYLLLLFPLSAFVLSLACTRLLVWLLPKAGMIDDPKKDGRRVHEKPVPRGGGIGFSLVFIVVCAIYNIYFGKNSANEAIYKLKILMPLGILLPLGILDDRFSLKPFVKFLFQVLAAFLAWYLGARIDRIFMIELPLWLNCAISILWITTMINAFNMIDGIDGLAAGIGIISSISMAAVYLGMQQDGASIVLLCLAGSLLGFLRYNWHPARLFMGDTGSMFIGYMLGIVGSSVSAKVATVASIFVPLLACGIPFIDISLAVWRRLTRLELSETEDDVFQDNENEGRKTHQGRTFLQRLLHLLSSLVKGDKSHLHHRLLRHFDNNQPKTVFSIYGIAVFMSGASLLCYFLPMNFYLLEYIIALTTLSLVIHRFAVIELWNSTQIIFGNFQRAEVGIIMNALHPLLDFGAVLASFWLVTSDEQFSIRMLLMCMSPVVFILIVTRNYRVFWNFPSSEEYFRLLKNLGIGYLGTYFISTFFRRMNVDFIDVLFAYSFAALVMLSERLFLHYLRIKLIRYHDRSDMDNVPQRNVVLYGICPQGRMYVNSLCSHLDDRERQVILGFADRDRRYRQGFCYGMRVLGTLNDLASLQKDKPIYKIVICQERTDDGEMERLRSFCSENGIKLCRYVCEEQPLLTDGQRSDASSQ